MKTAYILLLNVHQLEDPLVQSFLEEVISIPHVEVLLNAELNKKKNK